MTISTDQLEEATGKKIINHDGNEISRNGEVIPIHLMERGALEKPAGQYYLVDHTCDGACSVGIPKKECVDKNIYVEGQCSRHHLEPVESLRVSVADLKKAGILIRK